MELVGRVQGLHIALLTAEELAAFRLLCAIGKARAEYSGVAALFGIGRVALIQ